ncbi:MAG: hypothetical protein LBK25_00955, partial [Treponema sp.]|nr:hypothetical protein [Treponema sp.]
MVNFIKIICIIALSLIIFSVIIGAIISCTTSKNKENNKILAQIELNLLMFKIENKIINLNKLSDQEYIDIGHKFVTLINITGKIKSSKEHYFRNYFSRAPQILDEMVKIIMNKEDNIFKWELLPWQKMAFHMYGKDGEYNLKFISSDGYFEAVYNRDGMLLTQENDPLNMGTFNYAHQLANQMTHYNLDVWPYFMWNNTPEAMAMGKEATAAQPIDKNEE